MANIYYYYQEKTIDKNDLPMAASIGRKQFLVGKWPMADRYIVLCIYVYMIRHWSFEFALYMSHAYVC